MRAIIFVNGDIADVASVRHWVREGDDLIAADGGAHHAMAMGLRPRVIVGDLDSLEPEVVEALAAAARSAASARVRGGGTGAIGTISPVYGEITGFLLRS